MQLKKTAFIDFLQVCICYILAYANRILPGYG